MAVLFELRLSDMEMERSIDSELRRRRLGAIDTPRGCGVVPRRHYGEELHIRQPRISSARTTILRKQVNFCADQINPHFLEESDVQQLIRFDGIDALMPTDLLAWLARSLRSESKLEDRMSKRKKSLLLKQLADELEDLYSFDFLTEPREKTVYLDSEPSTALSSLWSTCFSVTKTSSISTGTCVIAHLQNNQIYFLADGLLCSSGSRVQYNATKVRKITNYAFVGISTGHWNETVKAIDMKKKALKGFDDTVEFLSGLVKEIKNTDFVVGGFSSTGTPKLKHVTARGVYDKVHERTVYLGTGAESASEFLDGKLVVEVDASGRDIPWDPRSVLISGFDYGVARNPKTCGGSELRVRFSFKKPEQSDRKFGFYDHSVEG